MQPKGQPTQETADIMQNLFFGSFPEKVVIHTQKTSTTYSTRNKHPKEVQGIYIYVYVYMCVSYNSGSEPCASFLHCPTFPTKQPRDKRIVRQGEARHFVSCHRASKQGFRCIQPCLFVMSFLLCNLVQSGWKLLDSASSFIRLSTQSPGRIQDMDPPRGSIIYTESTP